MSSFTLVFVCLFALCFPFALLLWWKNKSGQKLWPFIAGAICFVVFSQILEQICHIICLLGNNYVSRAINGSTVLYALYGGFSAGIFEELGRFFGFKVLLRRHDEFSTSVAYGIGHGGIEVIIILGVSYLIYALASFGLFHSNPETESALINAISSVNPSLALVACLERIIAVTLHIGLSMIVFTSTKKSIWWLLLAVLLHAAADIPAVFFQEGILPVWIIEVWCAVLAFSAIMIGVNQYKKSEKQSSQKDDINNEEIVQC